MHAATAEPIRVSPPEAVVYQVLIKTALRFYLGTGGTSIVVNA